MRVRIVGDNDSARSVRGLLVKAGVVVSEEAFDFEIVLNRTQEDFPRVDGVDCELERLVVTRLSERTNAGILLARPGGNRSDRKLVIALPNLFSEASLREAEIGIMEGVVQFLAKPANVDPPKVAASNYVDGKVGAGWFDRESPLPDDFYGKIADAVRSGALEANAASKFTDKKGAWWRFGR